MPELLEDTTQALESTTVGIFRTATVVKGGRRFSFAALVVVGDRRGSVGIGYGKGRGVPVAIEKAQKAARKNLVRVEMKDGTLPHPIEGRFGASMIRLLPAAPGTGVIAGGTARAVLEMAGVQDCLTKAYGSTNKKNLSKAVLDGLTRLRTKEQVASHRGVEIDSTAVEEMIAMGKRFTTQTSAAPKQAVQPVAKNDNEAGGKRGGRRGGRRTESTPGGKGVTATVTQSKPKPKPKPPEAVADAQTQEAAPVDEKPVTQAVTEQAHAEQPQTEQAPAAEATPQANAPEANAPEANAPEADAPETDKTQD
jgi:small subunit ribosomal protein S5